jgi:phosphate starvation-inducible PhoH-like protein
MKMFLTRMGHASKIVVTGDMTQIDLPRTVRSGLADAVHRLRNVEGICIMHLDETDIVRNPLVTKIVQAYDDDVKPRARPQAS